MRIVRRTVVLLAAVFVAIQFVPYGWRHSNPAVQRDTPWPSGEARTIAVAACYDCHSNETNWRWYSFVAPVSWLVRKDVDEGRDKLNFSRYGDDKNALRDAAASVREGDMPPDEYTRLHPDAKLSPEEKQILLDALDDLDAELRDRRSG